MHIGCWGLFALSLIENVCICEVIPLLLRETKFLLKEYCPL